MKYSSEIHVTFWNGENKYSDRAKHNSVLRVESDSDSGSITVGIEHEREDVCDPDTGYGTDTNYAFAELCESELDTLIAMLEICKSKLKQGN
jgi:hypothetical protein